MSFLFIISISCHKEKEGINSLSVWGEWIWIESNGGIKGETIKPAINITNRMIFDDFFVSKYINDSLISKEEYELSITSEILIGTTTKTIIKYDKHNYQAIIVGPNELELIDQCYDCYFHRYRRK